MKFKKKILSIGAGYVGAPSMVMIASKCPDYKVTVVDINVSRINAWNSDQLPVYEPGLDAIVKKTRGRNLFFSADVEKQIQENDIIFVCVNTPTKTFGAGAGMAADLQYWEKTARQILENSQSSKIVIEKSTLPIKTAQAMERILASGNGDVTFDVLSNPEFMAEGTAVSDLENPDRVLIGSRETQSGLAARAELVKIYSHWVSPEKIITSNIWSAELSKLVANAFLAQRVSSINAISALCEKTDADISEVARAVGTDSRIGSKFLKAGIGFGGSCFKKDILNLVYLCHFYGLPEVAAYWESVVKINEYQQERFIANVLQSMFNTLAGKKICVLGFAFKADTGDTRESPAINITRKLLAEHAEVVITDPKALTNAAMDLAQDAGKIRYVEDPYQAAAGCHALVIMTDWDLYRNLDYRKIYKSMVKPAFIFDGRNIVDQRKCFEIGFNVFPIGKPALSRL
ncbi:MAG: nucleotide sugar dehydrogenase [Smithellaceae bacterium]|jgi:UDPglucose 6-dehydrogenase|nr:nucleotide sugar dehydrogenase [Smithellaceae bacterium]HBJ74467.1 nucleotide sugar dehydrogenase [Syntrophaceae bacterium]MDD5413931.1 nucleotide sugar dehydrogenase [Smithellaceae bacterium]HBL52852.1 nucleotide sugar dehydrogenase [Syntrophaceae bacterium]HCS76475.1 nucleotide sugar dehydrogenase [Syntrophaceae bacterium]